MVGREARFSCQIICLAFAPYSTYDVPEEPWLVPAVAEFPAMADDIWDLALPLDDMPLLAGQKRGQPNGAVFERNKDKAP